MAISRGKKQALQNIPHVSQMMIKLLLKCIHRPHSDHITIQPVPLITHPIRKLEQPNIQHVPWFEHLEAMLSSTIILRNLIEPPRINILNQICFQEPDLVSKVVRPSILNLVTIKVSLHSSNANSQISWGDFLWSRGIFFLRHHAKSPVSAPHIKAIHVLKCTKSWYACTYIEHWINKTSKKIFLRILGATASILPP